MSLYELSVKSPLLPAILANPDDILARLAHADWLSEQGAEEWAEFIRDGVALEECGSDMDMANLAEQSRLRDRLLFFAFTHGEAILPGLGGQARHGFHRCPCGTVEARATLWWTNGFIFSVNILPGAWLLHGPMLVRTHPIRSVRLHRRGNPPRFRGEFILMCGQTQLSPRHLPWAIYRHLPFIRHQTHEEADHSISQACLTYAKEKEWKKHS